MNTSIIEKVVKELKTLPQPLQWKVLNFARTLVQGHSKIKGVSGQEILRFAGVISSDDLQLMKEAIEQDCQKVDLNEW